MDYKACIFDLDGTLTDTLESLTFSVNETMKEIGLPGITQDQCRQFVGNGARVLIEKTLRAGGDEKLSLFDKAFSAYGRIFDENCTYHVTPYPGIVEMLEELKREKVKLAVLSNKPHAQAVKVVKEIFGEGVFDYVSGQQEGIEKKPDPAGVEHIMETLQVDKSSCLYVGDSEVDVQTGKNAGVKTIIVSWGFRTREELNRAGAGTVIDAPGELLEYTRQ